MSWLEILILGFGLSMDAMAVSVAAGMNARPEEKRALAWRLGAAFGFFQALMPLLGWLAGVGLRDFITNVDHWIAFALLSLVGGKMLHEAFRREEGEKPSLHPGENKGLLLLAVATSIDALAVGLGLAFLDVPIVFPALLIGCITFTLSWGATLVGHRCGRHLGNRVELAGGVILILIGIKILVEHLS